MKSTQGSGNAKFLGLQTDNSLEWENHIHPMILCSLSGKYQAN